MARNSHLDFLANNLVGVHQTLAGVTEKEVEDQLLFLQSNAIVLWGKSPRLIYYCQIKTIIELTILDSFSRFIPLTL